MRPMYDAGPALLLQAGLSPTRAWFARTHGQWQRDATPPLEEVLVALADTIWRGKRDHQLEQGVVERLAALSAEEPWAMFLVLGGILQGIAADHDMRLTRLAQQPAT